jgi:hypothetical protein
MTSRDVGAGDVVRAAKASSTWQALFNDKWLEYGAVGAPCRAIDRDAQTGCASNGASQSGSSAKSTVRKKIACNPAIMM